LKILQIFYSYFKILGGSINLFAEALDTQTTVFIATKLLSKRHSALTPFYFDYIARDQFGDWNAPDAVKQAAVQAQELREHCIQQGQQSLAFETVLSMPDKIAFMQQAKHAGFFIRLLFVGTDHPAINAKRVALRVMEGGHDVPITKIISRYTRSLANCVLAARIAHRVYICDNSEDDAPARLLFRTSEGKLIKQYGSINPWAMEILRSIHL